MFLFCLLLLGCKLCKYLVFFCTYFIKQTDFQCICFITNAFESSNIVAALSFVFQCLKTLDNLVREFILAVCLVQFFKYSVTGSLYSFKNRSFFCFYQTQMCIDKLIVQSGKIKNITIWYLLMKNSFYLLYGFFNLTIYNIGLTVIVNTHQHYRFIPKSFLLSGKEFPDRLIILCKIAKIVKL